MELPLFITDNIKEQWLSKAGECGPEKFFLLEMGARLVTPKPDTAGPGEELLWDAVLSNNPIACSFLINHGVNVNTQDKDKRTPLMAATEKRYAEVCLELLKNGARITLSDKDGNSALNLADEKILILLMKFAPIELKRKLTGETSPPD
jgi:hypothetical protein